jgi:NADP-dependent 3-hydroxy acid dehydrogenase YdfG
MKVAITGASRGLGKVLGDTLIENYPDCEIIGFSRANGYDISDPKIQDKIVEESKDCELFINNAYSGYAQAEIMVKMLDVWKHEPNHWIVNVGSLASYHDKRRLHPYSVHKIAVDRQAEQIQANFTWPKVINFRPALFESDMGFSSEFNRWRKKIPIGVMVENVMYCIDNRYRFTVKDIVIDLP